MVMKEKKRTYRMSLHGVKVAARLGLRDHEQKTPQPLEMDVDLEVRCPLVFEEEHISREVPSYSDIRSLLIEAVTTSHTPLLETLALRLVDLCLQEPGVERVCLKLSKPMALKGGVASVTFEGEKEGA
jgi:dihydroneopterin aldolase